MDNKPNKDQKKAVVTNNNDILIGSITLVLIIIFLAFLVLMLFDFGIDKSIMNIIVWVLLGFLVLGGVFLIVTHLTFKTDKRKKTMFIGGIIISVLAILSMVFHGLGWIV